MPSSPTASNRLEKQFTGENINLWGVLLDGMLDMLDSSLDGMATIALSGDYALSSHNFVADEARNRILKFTGALAINATVTVPSLTKAYFAWNATNVVLTFTAGAGGTVSIDPGDLTVLICDGVNVKTISFGGLDLKTFIAASVLAATGTLPALPGNAGKFIKTDATNAFWAQVMTTDLGDYAAKILGVQVALAVAL